MAEVKEKFLKHEEVVEESDEIDLIDYVNVLWKWKGLIIGGTILCMVAAAVISLTMPNVYRATSLLLVSDPKFERTDFARLPSIDTYVAMIKSQAIARKVLEELGLNKPPYQIALESLINGMVSVAPIRGTTLIRIDVEYTDPEKARDIANAVAASASELNKALNEDEAVRSRDFLKAQLDEISLTLSKAEQELLAFKETSEIAVLKKEIDILLKEKETIEQGFTGEGKVGTQAGLLEIDRAIEEKNIVIDTLTKKLGSEKKILELSRSISNDSVMQDIVKETSNLPTSTLLGLQIKNEQVNPLYMELEPELVKTHYSLESLKARKVALIKDLESTEKRLIDLQKELAQREMKLENLTRAYELTKEIHKSLKQKFEEARLLVAAKTQELKIVDPAITPKSPIKPNRKANVFIAGAAGFMSLILLAFVLEYTFRYKTDRSIKSHLN